MIFFKDGRSFERISKPLYLDGEPKGRVWSFLDITERIQSEEKINKANQQLLTTLNSLPIILFEVDCDGRIFDYRAPKSELLYAPPEMFLGKTIREILPEESSQIIYQAIAETIATGSHKGGCYSLHTPAGLHWFELSISVKSNSLLKQEHYIVLVNDISERKLAEEKVEMLASIVKFSVDCIVITDNDFNITFVNDSLCKCYDFSQEELIGKPISLLHSQNNSPELNNSLFSALAKKEAWTGRALNTRKSGIDFPVSVTISPIINEKGVITHFVGINRDITQQKQHEQILLQAKEEAQTANSAKSDFLANMSHELRTPLNGIIGMAELTSHTSLDTKQLHFVQNIKKSGESLLAIINDLLDFSKIEAGKMELQKMSSSFAMNWLLCLNRSV